MRQAVLGARLLELLARDHDGDGGLGDEVVGEGAEEDTGAESVGQYIAIRRSRRRILPFEGAAPTRSQDDEGGVEHVDLGVRISIVLSTEGW